MNNGKMFVNRLFILIVLCLPATVVCAATNIKNISPNNAATKLVTPEQKTAAKELPEKRPEKRLEKTNSAWQLHAEQWELARSGETILSMPVLNKVIKTWLSKKNKKIEIQYPGGEDGELWVQELTDWLVSLGIPSKNIIITPGSGTGDVIKFDIIE